MQAVPGQGDPSQAATVACSTIHALNGTAGSAARQTADAVQQGRRQMQYNKVCGNSSAARHTAHAVQQGRRQMQCSKVCGNSSAARHTEDAVQQGCGNSNTTKQTA